MADQPYTVPIVLQDLPPAEALHQVFDNLKNLDITISDVFTRIAGRIKTEREKVAKVVSRVEAATVKVKQISENQTKVTTIYSTSKYPAPKILPDFRRIAPPDSDEPIPPLEKTDYILTKKQTIANPASVDTSSLFNVLTRNRAARADTENPLDETAREGLGRLPSYFPSISSILLFNSSENPYKDYVSINNLEGVGGQDRESGQEGIADAPTSIHSGAFLPVFGGLGYDYKPDLGDVPVLQLPDNLPLGKLVTDLRYGASQERTDRIAPSVAILPSLPQFPTLPAITSTKKAAPQSAPSLPALVSSSSSSAPPPPSVPSAPSLAPPPAPSMSSSAPIAPPMDDSAPPPPPMDAPEAPPMAPPPSAPRSAPPTAPSMDDDKDEKEPAGGGGGGGGGHDDLMAAIRNAKKGTLRKVAQGVVDEKRVEKAAAAKQSEPMDIMSALKARLAMRHKAMTGRHEIVRKEETSAPKSGDGDDDEPKAAPTRAKMSDVVIAAVVKHNKTEDDEDGDWADS